MEKTSLGLRPSKETWVWIFIVIFDCDYSHASCAELSAGGADIGRLSDLVSRDYVIDIELERVALVHRATAVFSDSTATNYAVLQSHPNSW